MSLLLAHWFACFSGMVYRKMAERHFNNFCKELQISGSTSPSSQICSCQMLCTKQGLRLQQWVGSFFGMLSYQHQWYHRAIWTVPSIPFSSITLLRSSLLNLYGTFSYFASLCALAHWLCWRVVQAGCSLARKWWEQGRICLEATFLHHLESVQTLDRPSCSRVCVLNRTGL